MKRNRDDMWVRNVQPIHKGRRRRGSKKSEGKKNAPRMCARTNILERRPRYVRAIYAAVGPPRLVGWLAWYASSALLLYYYCGCVFVVVVTTLPVEELEVGGEGRRARELQMALGHAGDRLPATGQQPRLEDQLQVQVQEEHKKR